MKLFAGILTFFLFNSSSLAADCLPSQTAQRKIIAQTLPLGFMNSTTSKICSDLSMLTFLRDAKVSMEESISIFGYVSEKYFHDVNVALRTPARFKKLDLKRHLDFANVIKAGLRKLPPYKGQVIRYDTRLKSAFLNHKVGDVIEQKAFTSSSAIATYEWQDGSAEVKIFIESKTGRSIIPLTPSDEQEVIFLPGTKFSIEKMKDHAAGYLEFHWTELK